MYRAWLSFSNSSSSSSASAAGSGTTSSSDSSDSTEASEQTKEETYWKLLQAPFVAWRGAGLRKLCPGTPVPENLLQPTDKVQGDEFDFIIIYLDTPNMPAVGYTALSRVKDGKSDLLGGQYGN